MVLLLVLMMRRNLGVEMAIVADSHHTIVLHPWLRHHQPGRHFVLHLLRRGRGCERQFLAGYSKMEVPQPLRGPVVQGDVTLGELAHQGW